MKRSNLFLMLAAMASLFSCQKENSVSDEGMVDVEFHASASAPTRTVFGDKDEDSYPVLWTTSKNVRIYVGTSSPVSATPSTAGASTTFSATLPSATSGTLRVLSPEGTYSSTGTCVGGFTQSAIASSYTYANCVIPSEQTPLASSCDEAAQLAAASMDIPSTGIPSSVDLHFSLVNAFGRLVVSGISASTISSVELSFPESVAGNSCRYTLSDGTITNADKSIITLSTGSLVKDSDGCFTIWFGCAPASMTSGTFSVTVTDGSGKEYSKSVALSSSKALVFTAGHVRPVEVAFDESSSSDSSAAPQGTVLWAETWTGGTANETPSNYGFEGTTVYGGGSVTYTQSSSETKLYDASLAGGSTPELLLKKSSTTWTISGIPTGEAKTMTLTLKSNKTSFSVSSTTSGVSVSWSGTTWTITNSSSASTITLVFKTTSSDNVRLDDLSLVVTTSGSGSSSGSDDSGETSSTVVTTGSASDVTTSTATLNATYSGASATPGYAGFHWGTSKTSLTRDVTYSSTILSSTSGSFSASIDNLSEGVTYYYQAYVMVLEGSSYVEYTSSSILSFTTEETQAVTAGDQLGWFELPLMNYKTSGSYKISTDDSNNYYAYHWCAGGEKAPSGCTARNYAVCFSGKHHCPLWVAAPRHSMYVGSASRTDSYGADDCIPSNLQYSSKSTGGNCNKGHMLGSAERTSSSATNKQVFYYSNIAPQLSSGFNTGGGGWNTLEDWVDGKVCADTLYEVVGCYFDKYTDAYGYTVSPSTIEFGGRTDVSMPTMFYYVLLRTKSGSSGKSVKDCSASELMCAAFVRAHTNSLKGQAVTSTEMMSVSDLEKITGFTYFVNVPNAPKSTFTASDWGL